MPMSNDLNNPHDTFFRAAFARPEVATPFFQHYLPPDALAHLDLNTLGLEKDSFIDEHLREHRADLLFSVTGRAGQPVLIYLLLEHKSYQDRWTAFQMLGYVLRILGPHAGDSKRLPAVLSLVIYHGETVWSAPTTVEDLTDAPAELAALVPRFGFQLCDLSQAQLDGLRERAALAMVLQVLKFIRSDELNERLPEILALFHELHGRREQKLAFLEIILRYLAAAAGQLDERTVRAALRKALLPYVEEKVMPTIAESWLAQGEARGEARGEIKGELKQARHKLRLLLTQRFGTLPPQTDQRIADADLETLDRWFASALSATDLATVFSHET